MGHVDDGDPQAAVQLAQFVLQVFAQLLVQRAKGLVHQQDARLVHQRPGNGHALLLTTGELGGAAVGELFQLHQLEHGVDPLGGLGGALLADRQGKAMLSRTDRCGNSE